MLTLTRRSGECIRIGDEIRIVIREVRGRQVRIGIEAPGDVTIHREEVYLRIRDEVARTAKAGQTAGEPVVRATVVRRGPRRQTEPESGVAPPA